MHVLVNAGKRSMWTHTLREVSECIRKSEKSDHSLALAHVGWEVPSITYSPLYELLYYTNTLITLKKELHCTLIL